MGYLTQTRKKYKKSHGPTLFEYKRPKTTKRSDKCTSIWRKLSWQPYFYLFLL